MTPDVDLGAYFERIGYTGERAATLDTLRATTGPGRLQLGVRGMPGGL